jgi:hypothetical protein
MEQHATIIKNKPNNDKLIMERFNKFITQKKDFGDDVFSIIKEFMIEPKYSKSYRFKENREMRCCESKVDKTTFFIGKRYGNLIQIKQLRHHDEAVENPQFKFYKIKTMEMRNSKNNDDIIFLEYTDIMCEANELWNGSIEILYNFISADKYKNKLWNETDEKNYGKYMREMEERYEMEYNDFQDDMELIME